MALHTTLPIYKHAYGLLRLSLVGKRHMPRDFKNSLGSRIHDECIEVLTLIADANQLPDALKPPVIQDMLRRVGKIEFLLRVCPDSRPTHGSEFRNWRKNYRSGASCLRC